MSKTKAYQLLSDHCYKENGKLVVKKAGDLINLTIAQVESSTFENKLLFVGDGEKVLAKANTEAQEILEAAKEQAAAIMKQAEEELAKAREKKTLVDSTKVS